MLTNLTYLYKDPTDIYTQCKTFHLQTYTDNALLNLDCNQIQQNNHVSSICHLSTQQQKNDGAKRAESKDLDLLRNSSEDADYEPADENSPQISFDSIDTDFQLSTTSHTNSDMHIQYSNPSSGAHSPRKSSLEIKVQNKKGDDLPLNDKDIGENCRRIEAFSDEEDFNETDNDRADSFINNSKKASMGFRDINSDLDSVSFNSDIENAVQSTQSTKNVVSPPFFPGVLSSTKICLLSLSPPLLAVIKIKFLPCLLNCLNLPALCRLD